MKYYNHRIYSNQSLIANTIINLEDQSHYLQIVLRLKLGDKFRIFNARDGEYIAQIIGVFSKNLQIAIGENIKIAVTKPELILGLCVIKADKMLDAVNMAVQIGVTEIIPLFAQRSQSRNINAQRIEKYIIEATEQSERLDIPTLKPAMLFAKYIDTIPESEMIIYANEQERDQHGMKSITRFSDRISVVIGPEGGFIPSELALLSAKTNAISVSLGENILRTETAVAVALAQVQLLRLSS